MNELAAGMILSSKIFAEAENQQFAVLSGDFNPMHTDDVAARRTQAGARVVHGVHALVWALERALSATVIDKRMLRLRTRFLKWIYLGDAAVLRLVASSGEAITLQVEVESLPVLSVEIFFGVPCELAEHGFDVPPEPLKAPLPLSFDELRERSGLVSTPPPTQVAEIFPLLAKHLEAEAVAEMIACSYVVGMETPGLHSMFSKLDLTFFKQTNCGMATALKYQVTHTDERFSKVRIGVRGGMIKGVIEAFMREPPVLQESIETLAALVNPGEFRGVRALVVGGSRGLGELTAKLIAAGGGSVTITYARGKQDAEAVAKEIRDSDRRAFTMAYDVHQPAAQQIGHLPESPTHLFYFASGTIFKPRASLLTRSALAEFLQFYVYGFYDLCMELVRARSASGEEVRLHVLYPSTVFLEERPRGLTEYAMAKAAGEQLCHDVNLHVPGIRIISPRVPKLATDQTASVLPSREVSSSQFFLKLLRSMSDSSAA